MPAAAALTVTSKRTAVSSPGLSVPPCVAVAPVPTRNTAALVAELNSAVSSPGASVFGPVPAPLRTTRLLGTYLVLGGNWSWTWVETAGSRPVFVSSIVYSSLSPTWAGLFPLRSTTFLGAGGNVGANRSVEMVSTPG